MNNFYNTSLRLFEHLKTHLISEHDGKLYELNDPNEQNVIGSHYANSHFSVGAILLGHFNENKEIKMIGIQILESFFRTSSKYEEKNDYHFDFNNYALAILWAFNKHHHNIVTDELNNEIEYYLLKAIDSNHYTVNWLLMREFNNLIRYKISHKYSFKIKSQFLKKLIKRAINSDGLIEDRLPIGKSANIQYHTYSLSIMILGNHLGITAWDNKIIDNAIHWIEKCIDPMGDFNYFGRGTNQIFGWSSILFITCFDVFEKSNTGKLWTFFDKNIDDVLKRNSLLLESINQSGYQPWYDYHYSSVYQAHLFFWLSLGFVISNKNTSKNNFQISNYPVNPINRIKIHENNEIFIVVYEGSKHYLAERGPQICNITLKKSLTLFKGPFGPFFNFGNKVIRKSHAIENYFGPISEKQIDSTTMSLSAIFPSKLIFNHLNDNSFKISFIIKENSYTFNIPLFNQAHINNIRIQDINGNEYKTHYIGSTLGSFGLVYLFRTKEIISQSEIICIIYS